MDERDRQFLQLYTAHRYDDQRRYYEERATEYEAARRQALNLTFGLMALTTVASLLASMNVLAVKQTWELLAVLFPLLSTAVSGLNSLYAFEQQAKLFRDAVNGLLRANIERPDHDRMSDESAAQAALLLYVQQVEGVLRKEQGQWGQLMSEVKLVQPPSTQSSS